MRATGRQSEFAGLTVEAGAQFALPGRKVGGGLEVMARDPRQPLVDLALVAPRLRGDEVEGGLDVDDERVYISNAEGEVLALRRRSGVDLWKQSGLRMRRLSAPAVIGKHVAVADFEGYVHWLDVETGAFVARSKTGGRISNPPVVVGDLVVFQDDEGRVTALRPR